LILSARRQNVLEEIRGTLTAPDEHTVVPLDLEDYESLGGIVQAVLSSGVSVDVLINNGGISQRSAASETDLSVDRRIMDTNYFGTVAMTKALLPHMISRRDGCIASVSSVAGKVGSQLRSAYSGSKFAVVGFMECLAAEVHQYGVGVTVICPGFVKTNISVNALNGVGESEDVMDPTIASGMSAHQCATQIIRAIEKGRPEVVIGKGLSKWAPTIKRVFPGLVRWVTRSKIQR